MMMFPLLFPTHQQPTLTNILKKKKKPKKKKKRAKGPYVSRSISSYTETDLSQEIIWRSAEEGIKQEEKLESFFCSKMDKYSSYFLKTCQN